MRRKKIGHTTHRILAGSPHGAGPGVVRTLSACVLILLMTGCATQRPASPDEVLPQRAQARWDALLAGDFAAAYQYLSPGYRSGVSTTDFEIEFRTRRVQYLSAEYHEHYCEEAVCTVTMEVAYRVPRPVPGLSEWESTSPVKERWIRTEGQWWYLPE